MSSLRIIAGVNRGISASVCYYRLSISIKMAIIFLLSVCFLPVSIYAEEKSYFSTWELQHSGKYRLIWYYNTKHDLEIDQPNWVEVGDKKFEIFTGVRPPTINGLYMLEYSEVNQGEEVLDIGTGSGVHAIYAAEKAKRVVATDIFELAVKNARANAKRHGVKDKIEFRAGDLFEPLKDGEKFDVFFFNINFPFKSEPSDRKKLHERFFSEVHKFMKPDARIYYQTSFIKNFPEIYAMLNRHDFQVLELHMTHVLPYHHEPIFMMIKRR